MVVACGFEVESDDTILHKDQVTWYDNFAFARQASFGTKTEGSDWVTENPSNGGFLLTSVNSKVSFE